MENEVLDLRNDKEFNEYYNKRLGTEVNPNLPKELYNKSELKLVKDISDKIISNEIIVSTYSVSKLLYKIDSL
jgi:hypothetical protein